MLLTPNFRVDNAIRYVVSEAPYIWLILGRSTPWPGIPEAVPQDDPTATAIDGPICAFKANVIWVNENPSGTWYFKDDLGNNRIFLELPTAADVLDAMSNKLLLYADVDDNSVLTVATSYRQFGFSVQLLPAPGFESNTFLTPDQITAWGNLETIQSRSAVNCTVGSTNRIKEIIPA